MSLYWFTEMGENNPPFTVESFFEKAQCIRAFRYREVWPMFRWMLTDDSAIRFPNHARTHEFIRNTRKRWLQEDGRGFYVDNHQTFLVSMDRLLYFVIFHDGGIWLGTEGRL